MSNTEQRIRCNEFQRGIPETIEGWGYGICKDESITTIPIYAKSLVGTLTSNEVEEATDIGIFVIPAAKKLSALGLFITVTERDIDEPIKDYYIEGDEVHHKDKCRFFYEEPLPTISLILYDSANPGTIIYTHELELERKNGVLGSSYHHIPVDNLIDAETLLPLYDCVKLRVSPVSGFSIEVDDARLYIGYSKVNSGTIRYNMHTGMIEGDGSIDLYAYWFIPDDEELYFGYYPDIIPYPNDYSIYIGEDEVPSWFPETTDIGAFFYARRETYTGVVERIKVTLAPQDAGLKWVITSEAPPFPYNVSRVRYPIKSYYNAARIHVSSERFLKLSGERKSYSMTGDTITHGVNHCDHLLSDVMFEYVRFNIMVSSYDGDHLDQTLVGANPSIYVDPSTGNGDIDPPVGLTSRYSSCYLFTFSDHYPFSLNGSICTIIKPPEYQQYTHLNINAYSVFEAENVNYLSIGATSIFGGKTYGDTVFVQYEDGPGYDNDDVRDALERAVREEFYQKPVFVRYRIRVYAYGDSIVYEYLSEQFYDANIVTIPAKHINFIRTTNVRVVIELIDFQRDAFIHRIVGTYFPEHYPDGDQESIVDCTALDMVNIYIRCLRFGNYPGTGRMVSLLTLPAFIRGGIYHIRTPYEIQLYMESGRAVSKVYVLIVNDNYIFDPEDDLHGMVISSGSFSNTQNMDNQYPSKTITTTIPAFRFGGIKRIAVVFENDSGRGIAYATDGLGNPIRLYIHDPPVTESISLYTSYGGTSIVPIEDPLIVGQTIYVVKDEQMSIHMLRITSAETYDPECQTYPYFNESGHYDRIIMSASDLETFQIDTPGTFAVSVIMDGSDDVYHPIAGPIIVLPPVPAVPSIVEYPRLLATFATLAAFESSDLYEEPAEDFDYVLVGSVAYVWVTDHWEAGDIPTDDPLNEGKKTVILSLEPVYADASIDCPCIKYTTVYTIRFTHIPRLIGEFSTWEDLMAAYPTGGYEKDYAKVGDPAVNHVWGEVEEVMMWHPGSIPSSTEISEDTIEIPEYGAEHAIWVGQYEDVNHANHYFRLQIDEPGLYLVEYEGTGPIEDDEEWIGKMSFEVETNIDT